MKNYYKGLTRYCYSCNTDVVGSICRQTGKATCPHVDEQVHKIYRHQKGTRNKRITKTFQTTSYEEAMALAIAWDKQRENNSAMPVFKNENITTKNEPTILQMSAKYYSFVRDENVPDHLKEGLDEAYTKDIGRALKTLTTCLVKKNYECDNLRPIDFNDIIAGHISEYLLKEKKFGRRNYEKYIGYYKKFFDWIKLEGYESSNCFKKIKPQKLMPKPQAITQEEFDALLEKIRPENGMHVDNNGKQRNYYHNWLSLALRIALETGRRREDLINIRYSDIKEKNGMPKILLSEDRKVNNMKGFTKEDEKKINPVPISKNMLNILLNELEYARYKNTDRFLIAPEIKYQRDRAMSDILTRGFKHFFSQIKSDRKLTLKSIRKAFITHMEIITLGRAEDFSHHSGRGVLKYYIDENIKMDAIADKFSGVFPTKQEKRTKELTNAREVSNTNQISITR